MSKTYKGWELMKAIAEGKIKEGTIFSIKIGDSREGNNLIYKNEELKSTFYSCDVTNRYLIDKDYEFEVIEKEQDIDIQCLEEYDFPRHSPINPIGQKLLDLINENRKAIKQLDRKINREEK